MICSLSHFPASSQNDEVFVCLVEGVLHTSHYETANPHLFTASLFKHPNIQLSKDIHPPLTPKLATNKIFLPYQEPLVQKLRNAWREGGLLLSLEVLSDPRENISSVGCQVAKALLSVYRNLNRLMPALSRKQVVPPTVTKYKGVGPVVCMSWHPQCSKVAIVTCDDCVHLYFCGSSQTPVLKSQCQKNVSAVAWRPLTSCDIAVACDEGVYLWSLDPNLIICNRPSISSAVLYQADQNKKVSTLAWSPHGDILAVGSPENTTMYLWEVDMMCFTPLKRVGRGGISLLVWSPDNTKLISATTTNTFRIWETEYWESDVWSTAGGDVVAAVWSQEMLLFATRCQPFLYAMPATSTVVGFFLSSPETRTATRVVADWTRVTLPTGEIIGGEVVCMAWDHEARHLAVLFKQCEYVVVFVTDNSPTFSIAPGFLIKGHPNELPSTICFQNDFTEGANLTIAWSTGRIQYFPIIRADQGNRPRTPVLNQSGADKSLNYFSYRSP